MVDLTRKRNTKSNKVKLEVVGKEHALDCKLRPTFPTIPLNLFYSRM